MKNIFIYDKETYLNEYIVSLNNKIVSYYYCDGFVYKSIYNSNNESIRVFKTFKEPIYLHYLIFDGGHKISHNSIATKKWAQTPENSLKTINGFLTSYSININKI